MGFDIFFTIYIVIGNRFIRFSIGSKVYRTYIICRESDIIKILRKTEVDINEMPWARTQVGFDYFFQQQIIIVIT